MAPHCYGKCVHEKPISGKHRPYENGYKRCSTCCVYIKTTELTCYCCNLVLRVGTSRSKASKLRVLARY